MPGQPGGFALAIPFHEVLADESDLLRGELGPEHRGSFALRELGPAGHATREADVSPFPGHPDEADISRGSLAHIGTRGIDATEVRNVDRHGPSLLPLVDQGLGAIELYTMPDRNVNGVRSRGNVLIYVLYN